MSNEYTEMTSSAKTSLLLVVGWSSMVGPCLGHMGLNNYDARTEREDERFIYVAKLISGVSKKP